jgi:hypothetical protein
MENQFEKYNYHFHEDMSVKMQKMQKMRKLILCLDQLAHPL